MIRRTYIADGDSLGLEGEILVTVYDDAVTIAYRSFTGRTWGPPIIAVERP